jgi:hypothetical protein
MTADFEPSHDFRERHGLIPQDLWDGESLEGKLKPETLFCFCKEI